MPKWLCECEWSRECFALLLSYKGKAKRRREWICFASVVAVVVVVFALFLGDQLSLFCAGYWSCLKLVESCQFIILTKSICVCVSEWVISLICSLESFILVTERCKLRHTRTRDFCLYLLYICKCCVSHSMTWNMSDKVSEWVGERANDVSQVKWVRSWVDVFDVLVNVDWSSGLRRLSNWGKI